MGYAMLMAPCLVCGKVFGSNPRKVPSYQNNPICKPCIEYVNEERVKKGLPPATVTPDAYEPEPE